MKIAYIKHSGPINYTAANGFNEGTDLLPYLKAKGLDITAEIWDDPNVNWAQYDIALLKTPWDYHRKIDSFKAWLDMLEALGVRLINDYSTVRWNLDKRYLKDVIADGFNVIPSVFMEKGWQGDLKAVFTQLNTSSIIIKPCISGGSKNTIIVKQGDVETAYTNVVNLLSEADFIAQPLMGEIANGEWSYVFIKGRHSHTILKKPKLGDFRVQQLYGGTIEPLTPTNAETAQAAAYVERYAKNCLYARIDGLMVNGKFCLMELELIEPFLYLSYGKDAVENYYNGLVESINTGHLGHLR